MAGLHITARPGIDIIAIESLAFELLALFLADKPIEMLMATNNYPGIFSNYIDHKEARVFRLLIEIAAIYRLSSWKAEGKAKSREKQKTVGELYDVTQESMIDLSMHEACNKIIHADHMTFESRKIRNVQSSYMTGRVEIDGAKGKNRWVA